MSFLYLTADRDISSGHGGGGVVHYEIEALKQLGEVEVLSRDELIRGSDPWGWDEIAFNKLKDRKSFPKLCQIYSGSFTKTVELLKANNCIVSYTCAAHRVQDSKKAHEDLGIPYNYTHLTDPELCKKYSAGYFNSNVLIVPSQHSKKVVEEQMDQLGISYNRVEIIPHGCLLPKNTKLIPKSFVVGMLGSVNGPDKGLVYLLKAWKKLNYKDSLLTIAGLSSTSDYVRYLIETHGGGCIYLAGWQKNISDFYNNISLLSQYSCTEGFGLEILEAHAHGRCVICSDKTGAMDLVPPSGIVPAFNVEALVEKINEAKTTWDLQARGSLAKEESYKYSWDKIKLQYISLWKELLNK